MDGSEVWDHVNDSLDAGAWPLVVLICAVVFMVVFRHQIRDRISKIIKAKAGPVSLELEANQQANELFREKVPEVLGSPEIKAIASGPAEFSNGADAKTVTGEAHVEGRATITAEGDVARATGTVYGAGTSLTAKADDLYARREQVEDIIRAAWRAGVEAGQSGPFAEPLDPTITWTGSRPSITGWTQVAHPVGIRSAEAFGTPNTVHVPSAEVRRLEEEIRRLRRLGADRPAKSPTGDNLLYQELLDKLRRLDPTSPFA